MIGIIGFSTDLFLAWLGGVLFPWRRASRRSHTFWTFLARFRPKGAAAVVVTRS